MHRRSCIALSSALLACLVLPARPANAGCVSCGPAGECFDAPAGYSANCECRIRNVGGSVICKPHGVCDPRDATSCDEGPFTNVAPGMEISPQLIPRLAEKNPLLAGAVWGAITEEGSASKGGLRPRMAAGEYTGTMGQDGKSYTFRTRVQRLAVDSVSLSVLVEEDGTAHAEEFEGVLLDRGRSGSLVRVGQEGRTRVLTWSTREPER